MKALDMKALDQPTRGDEVVGQGRRAPGTASSSGIVRRRTTGAH